MIRIMWDLSNAICQDWNIVHVVDQKPPSFVAPTDSLTYMDSETLTCAASNVSNVIGAYRQH